MSTANESAASARYHELRKREIAELSRILDMSGQRLSLAELSVPPNRDGLDVMRLEFWVSCDEPAGAAGAATDEALVRAAEEQGWVRSDVLSHQIWLKKGDLTINGGCAGTGCRYSLDSTPSQESISPGRRITDAGAEVLPELGPYLPPDWPSSTPTEIAQPT